MPKPIEAPHVARAKRVAKKLQRALEEIGEQAALSDCQEAAARMMGYGDWHDLSKAGGFALAPPDEELAPDDLAQRRGRQFDALVEALPVLQSMGDDAVMGIVVAVKPSAAAPPRSVLEAAERRELAADAIMEGFESLGPEGPACAFADLAHEALGRDPADAWRLARLALTIDPECIDAHEVLGLVVDDPVDAVASHRRSSGRAKVVYAEAHRTWCAGHPSDDPKLFWEFIGARPYIRAHMNLGRALVQAADCGALERGAALKEAEAVFGHLLKVLPPRMSQDALSCRMMVRMQRGNAPGAARDADAQKRSCQRHDAEMDCWTAWTLAWAALAERKPGTVAIAEAIEACPFALPLLLDGGEEVDMLGNDRTGPKAAASYVAEARGAWLRTPGALAALEPFRAVAISAIIEAKRRFAANWGAALALDRRRPIPQEWRM